MARPDTTPKPDDLQPYTVTRAICIAGQRVEIGTTVHLTRVQGTELCTAGKLTPGAAKPTKPAKAAAKQAAESAANSTSEEAPT